MATSNPKKTTDETEEEVKLEAALKTMTEEKKMVFEATKEADERLRRIRKKEDETRDRLREISTERIEKEQMRRYVSCTEVENRLRQREMEALKTENEQLKRRVEALTKGSGKKTASATKYVSDSEELTSLRRKYVEQCQSLERLRQNLQRDFTDDQKEKAEREDEFQKLTLRIKCLETENQQLYHDKPHLVESGTEAELQTKLEVLSAQNEQQNIYLKELKENLQHVKSLLRAQQNDNKSLKMHIMCLEDKITAAQQTAVETQLRQLNELHSLTVGTRQMKEMLTAVHQQQQQKQHQPAAEQRHQGKCFNIAVSERNERIFVPCNSLFTLADTRQR